jgi:hypothetical protein
MKSNGNGNGHLQKFYGALTPRERAAALFEAYARKDEAEADALTDSAPRKEYEIVHHANEIHALMMLIYAYTANQLSAGLRMTTLFLWARKDEDEDADDGIEAARMSAYGIMERLAAWEALCKNIGVSTSAALFVTELEEDLKMLCTVAKTIAPDREEAAEIWTERGTKAEMPTRENILKVYTDAYEGIAHRWDRRI